MSEERYEIKKKLGEGGAGVVYIAHDARLDREVALKRLAADQGGWSQDTVDSMLKEARMLSAISHPNIVTIYDADVDEDGPYVVMEILKGRNIDDLIAESTLTSSDFQDFATQCLEALTAAHSLNLIHRDIKPNNIVLKWLPSGKFQAKLLDFGMAKLTKEPTKQTVDQSDSVFGSIYFMAPEQFERIELDTRTDLYALGSVFYYTLTGFYPFTGDSPAEVMASHLMHRVKPITDYRDDLPEWVTNWVMWLINREMEHRPQTAQEALDLFSTFVNSAPLKHTASVSTKFDASIEGEYFGRAEGDAPVINKQATLQVESAAVLAPILLGQDGTLISQQQEAVPVPIAQPTIKVAQPSTTVKLAPPATTVKLATPAPTQQVTLNTAAPAALSTPATSVTKPVLNTAPVLSVENTAIPQAQVAVPAAAPTVKVATPEPKTVKLATPNPVAEPQPETPLATVPIAAPVEAVTPAATVALQSPAPAATVALQSPAPDATVSLQSPEPKQTTTVTLDSPKPAGQVSKTVAPEHTQAAGSSAGPTKLKRVESKNPAGQMELPTADSVEAPKNNTGLYAILSMVAVALIVVGALLVHRLGENKKIEYVNTLLAPAIQKEKDIPTFKEDVSILLEQLYASSGSSENELVYRRLMDATSADGTDLDVQIAEFACQPGEDIFSEARKALFRVLGARKGPSIVPVVKDYIGTTENDEVAAASLLSIKKVVVDTDLGFLLDVILTTESDSKRNAAEEAASFLIENSKNQGSLGSQLDSAQGNAAHPITKGVLSRLIGLAGGENAVERIQSGLASGDKTKIIPALSMLKRWKDDTLTLDAIDFWVSSSDPLIRKKAFEAAFSLMRTHHMKGAENEAYWTKLAENVQTSDEKLNLLVGLGTSKESYAEPLVKPFLDDTSSQVIKKAKQAMRNLKK